MASVLFLWFLWRKTLHLFSICVQRLIESTSNITSAEEQQLDSEQHVMVGAVKNTFRGKRKLIHVKK